VGTAVIVVVAIYVILIVTVLKSQPTYTTY
jgi:hypothetical protein